MNGNGRQDGGSGNADQHDLHQEVDHWPAKEQLRDNTREKQQEGAVCHHLETGEQGFLYRSQGIPPSSRERKAGGRESLFQQIPHATRDRTQCFRTKKGSAECKCIGTAVRLTASVAANLLQCGCGSNTEHCYSTGPSPLTDGAIARAGLSSRWP